MTLLTPKSATGYYPQPVPSYKFTYNKTHITAFISFFPVLTVFGEVYPLAVGACADHHSLVGFTTIVSDDLSRLTSQLPYSGSQVKPPT